jgi:hypothetical protein
MPGARGATRPTLPFTVPDRSKSEMRPFAMQTMSFKKHTDADFMHSICPEGTQQLYPGFKPKTPS